MLKTCLTEEGRNRIKSLLWRSAMMGLAVLINGLAENLEVFNLSAASTVGLGLVLGEVSKYFNTKYELETKTISFLKSKFIATNNGI